MTTEERTLLKEVPATAGKYVVGVAKLYDDGSVDVILDPNAPPEGIKLYKEYVDQWLTDISPISVEYPDSED